MALKSLGVIRKQNVTVRRIDERMRRLVVHKKYIQEKKHIFKAFQLFFIFIINNYPRCKKSYRY